LKTDALDPSAKPPAHLSAGSIASANSRPRRDDLLAARQIPGYMAAGCAQLMFSRRPPGSLSRAMNASLFGVRKKQAVHLKGEKNLLLVHVRDAFSE